ncbi:MAG: hypothetical protein MOGMAGMI_00617 [Candidatus Omnitrophica bacterium]|nr:hypothetical protein [Candidatus Omnitrophota bacterium]
MTMGPAVAMALFLLVGSSIGLLGSGGSVLTVPILIYAAGLGVNEAIAASLLIVGCASAISAFRAHRQEQVNGRLVTLFVLPGTLMSFVGARLTPLVDERLLLTLFGGAMVAIGAVLAVKTGRPGPEGPVVCRPGAALSASIGALLGFLTGLLGVGGGFLIVPAIALLMKCSLRTAIGTSSAIIAINSLAGYAGHAVSFAGHRPWIAAYLGATLAGVWITHRRAGAPDATTLQRALAALIVTVGAFLALKNAL